MADPTIWCQLPPVILPLIIEHTADLETLRNWCHATRQKESTFLHRLAVRETYRVVTVNKDSLLCAPGGDGGLEDIESSDDDESDEKSEAELTDASGDESYDGYNSEFLDRNACTSVNEGPDRVRDTSGLRHDVRRDIHLREISQHIRKLILDFNFPRVETPEELTAFEDVELTVKALLSQPFVEEIEHDGVLYQQTLDRITNTPSLKVLKIRETPCWSPCTLRSKVMPDIRPRPRLTFVELRHMHSLKALHVSQLLASEGPGLGQAVRSLRNIEELYVGASPSSGEAQALPSFLESLFIPKEAEVESSLNSPGSSLKRFSLVDCHHTVFLTTRLLSYLKPLAKLQKLYLDLPPSGSFITLFLEATSTHTLTDLTISVYSEQSAKSLPQSLFRLLNRFRFTVQKLTFLDAWENYADRSWDIYCSLVPWMHLWQAYLTEPEPMASCDTEHRTLKWKIFGNISEPQMYRSDIRHLRLDHINIQALEVNKIDERSQGLQQLKVLFLRPLAKQVRDPMTGEGFRSLPYPVEFFGPDLPANMDTLRESQIAQEIAAQKLPSLRIIAVGRYKYWVEGKQREASSRKVWFLRRALEDPQQEAEILRTMDQDDWSFLADRSNCIAESPTTEQISKANRAVYRNEDVARGLQPTDI